MNSPKPHDLDRATAVTLARQSLNDGVDALPHHVSERLRASRVRALAQLKTAPAHVETRNNSIITWLQHLPSFTRGMVLAPVLFLAIFASQRGLMEPSSSSSAHSLAVMNGTPANVEPPNIDAILNEEIPLQAYLNNDFNQFNQQAIQGHIQKTGYQNGN